MKTETWKGDTLAFKFYDQIKVKCKYCNHSVTFPVFLDTKLCDYCGKKLKNNTRAYFKYKMRKVLKKEIK